jgi:hypothetical protein
VNPTINIKKKLVVGIRQSNRQQIALLTVPKPVPKPGCIDFTMCDTCLTTPTMKASKELQCNVQLEIRQTSMFYYVLNSSRRSAISRLMLPSLQTLSIRLDTSLVFRNTAVMDSPTMLSIHPTVRSSIINLFVLPLQFIRIVVLSRLMGRLMMILLLS